MISYLLLVGFCWNMDMERPQNTEDTPTHDTVTPCDHLIVYQYQSMQELVDNDKCTVNVII